MKEHNYVKHINGLYDGIALDKLQEGDFIYDERMMKGTLSEFAKKVRDDVNTMAKKNKHAIVN